MHCFLKGLTLNKRTIFFIGKLMSSILRQKYTILYLYILDSEFYYYIVYIMMIDKISRLTSCHYAQKCGRSGFRSKYSVIVTKRWIAQVHYVFYLRVKIEIVIVN